ncbi:hypothetical protein CEN46_11770 [Fischerella thermalis CCMEE 5318]|uniref:DUF6888 domain-containing protein n=2 Tax=Fischerella TaxID=1190 RepID=A0A2N6LG21_9CYAN|nr:hypothetical protein CEN46_11770 [Fischerella thermalis CCMEE 5318]
MIAQGNLQVSTTRQTKAENKNKMEPTPEHLRALYRRCVAASNMMQPINIVRMDERTQRIFMLIADTIEVEIFPNG